MGPEPVPGGSGKCRSLTENQRLILFIQECQIEALFPWNLDRAMIMLATRQEG